jgi:[ribosomal protein S18]-alanine N-acetyltransferase
MLRPFSTRRVRLADFDRILEIERACFGADAYDRKLFAEYFHKCGDLFLVIERRRSICGYILSCIRGRAASPAAELVSLAVEPAARRKGAASVLLAATLRRLRRRAVHRLNLMVKVTNRPAITFYEGQGFTTIRRVPRYYEDSADAFLMSRDL